MSKRPKVRHNRPPTSTVLAVACGGAVGALARYGVARGVPAQAGHVPWGTFLANVSGSALLGLLLTAVVELVPRGRLLRPLLGTGLIGAFTTWSTFAVEAVLLVRHGDPAAAALYVVASVAAGLAAAGAGVAAARLALRAAVRRAGEETTR